MVARRRLFEHLPKKSTRVMSLRRCNYRPQLRLCQRERVRGVFDGIRVCGRPGLVAHVSGDPRACEGPHVKVDLQDRVGRGERKCCGEVGLQDRVGRRERKFCGEIGLQDRVRRGEEYCGEIEVQGGTGGEERKVVSCVCLYTRTRVFMHHRQK